MQKMVKTELLYLQQIMRKVQKYLKEYALKQAAPTGIEKAYVAKLAPLQATVDQAQTALAPLQQAAQAGVAASAARVDQARSAYMPRASYSKFYQTSNQPVFAFGSLLNQRRFSEGNFAIDALMAKPERALPHVDPSVLPLLW